MIVIAILLWLAAAQWLLFAFLGYMESKGCNPFNTTWRIVILKPEWDPWASVLAGAVVVATLFVAGLAIYRYGLKRQVKTNQFVFDLIKRHIGAMKSFLDGLPLA